MGLCRKRCNYNKIPHTTLCSFSWYENPMRFGDAAAVGLVINRPGVGGAVLQVTYSSFSSQSSKHHYSQAIRARELKFWENIHPPPHVTCNLSLVTCHVSNVICHVSHVTCHMFFFVCFFWDKVLEIIGVGSVINGAYTKNHFFSVFWVIYGSTS